jgi:DUF438 domain-containing protein
MTFVDKDGYVKYFTQVKKNLERQNSHRPTCIALSSAKKRSYRRRDYRKFKSGKKDVEEFYINLKNMYVLIRYYAIRNSEGEYLGTLEITQDIAPIQAISGEKG